MNRIDIPDSMAANRDKSVAQTLSLLIAGKGCNLALACTDRRVKDGVEIFQKSQVLLLPARADLIHE